MSASLRPHGTLKPPAKDALDVGKVSFRALLTSVHPGWDVISPEDVFVKKKLKAKVQMAINKAVEAILAGGESSVDDDEYYQTVSIAKTPP
jgi:hypothetical protein